MFNSFFSFFDVEGNINNNSYTIGSKVLDKIEGFSSLILTNGGRCFGNGMYRIFSSTEITKWNDLVEEGYPKFKGRICCFGYDWSGRIFALDFGRMRMNQPLVIMFEPEAGEAYQIQSSFIEFHNIEIPNYSNEVLSKDMFLEWKSRNTCVQINRNECVGYIVPLFLNGKDDMSNLELIDMEVYWGISTQLINQIL